MSVVMELHEGGSTIVGEVGFGAGGGLMGGWQWGPVLSSGFQFIRGGGGTPVSFLPIEVG
jgi:hypothetical protein